MMVPLLAALLAAAPAGEDEAHRLDRLRTEQLNRSAAARVARRDAGNDAAQAAYQSRRAEYERAMARWRRQVDACRGGDRSAC